MMFLSKQYPQASFESGFVMILYKMRNTFIAAAMLNAINNINTASEPSVASIPPTAFNISMW